MSLYINLFQHAIDNIIQKNLFRKFITQNGQNGSHIIFNNESFLNFSSNDYLGLSHYHLFAYKVSQALEKYGTGAGASRYITGNVESYLELEQSIKQWIGSTDTLVFSSGYQANIGVIPTITSIEREQWIIFSDELNHASLIDGCKLSKCNVIVYNNRDMNDLEHSLQLHQNTKYKLIVSDAVFSMDGTLAPLEELVHLSKKYNAFLFIDEAHSFGTLGETGRGLCEHYHLKNKPDLVLGTLGKAFGSFGAFVIGDTPIIEFLRQKCRTSIFTTALPPSVLKAGALAIQYVQNHPSRIKKLQANIKYFAQLLNEIGFDFRDHHTPIFPIIVKEEVKALALENWLFSHKIFARAIRPPTVPFNTCRLRVTITAKHKREHLEFFSRHLQKYLRKF